MSSNRQLAFALVGLVILTAVGAALLVWPNYQKARDIDEAIARLHEKIEVLSVRNQALARLARRVNRATEVRDTECKRIPPSPEIAAERPPSLDSSPAEFTLARVVTALPSS